jgi:hypothetical protein
MKNLSRKLSALVLTSIFAAMSVSAVMDTGLGAGNGGAVINTTTGGFAGMTTGTNSATLNFDGNTTVNWNTLNVNGNETLNFNAVNGANGLTVLNTVNNGMSNIYGQINANSGIGKLIISNPNGVLFDGAKFSTAGDVMITTQGAAMGANGVVIYDPTASTTNYTPDGKSYVMNIKNSDFSVGGELNFVAPTMNVVKSAFKTANGAGNVRFTTTNGQDYFVTNNCDGCGSKGYTETQSMRLESINVDGDVYIVNNKGIVKTVNGGDIKGNLNVQSDGSVALNYVNNGNKLHVTGDVNAKANGPMMYARETNVDGNLNMTNGGGFLEVNNVNVGKDMNLTTVKESVNPLGYKHFVHVIGDTTVKGNATINAENNIHIGNYDYDQKKLLDGNFKVGKTLTAHAKNGHVMTTIDVTADKIHYTSDNYNILASEDALLTANEYSFKSNGYIGAIKDFTRADGKTPYTAAEQIVDIMETYTYIPKDIKSHAYMNIAGGHITNIETPKDAKTYIGSCGDVKLTGANAGDINLTALRKKIEITGDVHANNINIGPETDYLKLDFEGRDFTTNYTNIRDNKVVTIKGNEKITYELADGGYNQPTLKPGEKTTYLIGPGKEPGPEPQPQPGPDPTPGPDPQPQKPSNDDNVKVIRNVPDNLTAAQPNTPVAFAADLDDDEEESAVRKNVDGSVTVVRAFPMY